MATIRKRMDGKGKARFEAIIRLKRGGVLIHRESRTFSRQVLAKDWARDREAELAKPGSLDKLRAPAADRTLGALIHKYAEEFETLGAWGRTKGSALKALEGFAVARKDAAALTAGDLVDHVRTRRLEGAGPATAGADLTWIGVVLKAARGAWGVPVSPYIATEARETCKSLRLIGKSRRRTRRPTQDELQRLTERWTRRAHYLHAPMADVIAFAVASARRQDEITRLLWADLDRKASTILVRDVKHPDGAQGNHRVAKLTAEALAIIDRQPQVDGEPRIFPYNPRSIGAQFTRACRVLGITDLHFHDLRHEATSRLFEAGYQIHEVAQFTLHESWTELKRYTQLRPEGLKLRG